MTELTSIILFFRTHSCAIRNLFRYLRVKSLRRIEQLARSLARSSDRPRARPTAHVTSRPGASASSPARDMRVASSAARPSSSLARARASSATVRVANRRRERRNDVGRSVERARGSALAARATPRSGDRATSTDAYAADASFGGSLDASSDRWGGTTLSWSAVDYAEEFGAPWWTPERRARVGRTIESAVSDTMRERPDEGLTVERLVETLVSRGALRADERAALRQRAKRVGEDWTRYAQAEDRAVLKLRRKLVKGEDIRANALKLPKMDSTSIKDWTKSDWERFFKVVLASVIGGAALFASGGTATPALVTAMHGLGFGAEAFSAFGGLQCMLGVTGASLCAQKMANRTKTELENFDLIPLRGAHKSYAMHIFVPGFTRDDHDLLGAWGATNNQYVSVVPESRSVVPDLGIEFTSGADGSIIVQAKDNSIAKRHGVVSGSTLLSYRSVKKPGEPSVVLSELVDMPTPDELSRVPRPIEIRLQLPDRDDELKKEMSELANEIKSQVGNHSKEEHLPTAEAAIRPEQRRWGNRTGEQLVLNWEPSTLNELGACMTSWNETCTVNFYLTPAALAKTALGGIADAIAWPATLLSSAGFIDDPWALVKLRGKIAGEELAQSLLDGQHGHRPVTFVAYSAGAYVVQSCLQKLYEAGDRGKNIVDRAIFISAPISTSKDVWQPMREVVSGRLVNVHCHTDWILLLMWRFNMLDPMTRLAGLSIVKRVPSVENWNIKNLRHAHLPDEISRVLEEIDLQE